MKTTSKKIIFMISIASFLVTTAMGINIVLLPIILKTNNISEFYIGVSAVIDLGAGLLIAPHLNKISKHITTTKLGIISLLTYSILILFIPFFINYIIWLCYMVIFGLFWFCFFTINNTILNQYINNKHRSLIISLNTTIICLGITTGSAIVKFIGTDNYILYILCSILTLSTAIIYYISLSNLKIKFSHTTNQKLSYFIKKRPDIFLGRLFQEYISTTILVFMVIYGINNGFTPENAALIISFYTLSTVFDLLIGYISDRTNRLKHLSTSIIIATILMFIIYRFADQYYIILLSTFLLGTAIGYMYINCNSELNSYFKKEELIAANSCYSMTGNIGGIFASIVTGLLLQNLGNIGIFLPAAFLTICYFIIITYKKYAKNI